MFWFSLLVAFAYGQTSQACVDKITGCVAPYSTCLSNAGSNLDALCTCVNNYLTCFDGCTGGVDLSQYSGCSNGCFQDEYHCAQDYSTCAAQSLADKQKACDCLSGFINCVPAHCFGDDAQTQSVYRLAISEYGCQIALPGWVTSRVVFKYVINVACSDPNFQSFVSALEAKVQSLIPPEWQGFFKTVVDECLDTKKRQSASATTISATFTGPADTTGSVTDTLVKNFNQNGGNINATGYSATSVSTATANDGGLSGGDIAAIVICVTFFVFCPYWGGLFHPLQTW